MTTSSDKTAIKEDETTTEEDPECVEEVDFKRYESKVKELQTRHDEFVTDVEENADEIDELKKRRCEANMLFIESLKEHKLAIEVVEFLVELVDEYDFSLLQTGAFKRVQTNLLAIAMSTDEEGQRLAFDISEHLSLVEKEVLDAQNPEDAIFNQLHEDQVEMRELKSLMRQTRDAPHSFFKLSASEGNTAPRFLIPPRNHHGGL